MFILLKNVKSPTVLLSLSRVSSHNGRCKESTTTTTAVSQKNEREKTSVRFNEIGVQMIDEKLREYLFRGCQFSKPNTAVIKKVREHLKSFKLDPESTQKNPNDQIKNIPGKFNHE